MPPRRNQDKAIRPANDVHPDRRPELYRPVTDEVPGLDQAGP
jgi:hypothetical protein